jgi:hypothetical protein
MWGIYWLGYKIDSPAYKLCEATDIFFADVLLSLGFANYNRPYIRRYKVSFIEYCLLESKIQRLKFLY